MTITCWLDLARTHMSGSVARHQNCGGYPNPVTARAELKRRFHAHSTPETRARDGRTFTREGSAVVITQPHTLPMVTVIDFEEPGLFNQED